MRCNFTPIQAAHIKTRQLGCGEKEAPSTLGGTLSLVQALSKAYKDCSKKLRTGFHITQDSTSWQLPQEKRYISLKRYLHSNVQCSPTNNSKDTEITQVRKNRLVNKEIVCSLPPHTLHFTHIWGGGGRKRNTILPLKNKKSLNLLLCRRNWRISCWENWVKGSKTNSKWCLILGSIKKHTKG